MIDQNHGSRSNEGRLNQAAFLLGQLATLEQKLPIPRLTHHRLNTFSSCHGFVLAEPLDCESTEAGSQYVCVG